MNAADLERRIAYLESELARDDLNDWARAQAEAALALNLKSRLEAQLAHLEFELRYETDRAEQDRIAKHRDRIAKQLNGDGDSGSIKT